MPQFGTIFMENKSRAALMAQPKFAALDAAGKSYRGYEGTSAPSLPDYCAFTCGGYAFSQGHFGGNPNGSDSGTVASSHNANIFTQLEAAGHSWKSYEEGAASAGFLHSWGSDLGNDHFATRHCPACFYADTFNRVGANHGNGRYDFDELAYDIAHGTLPDFYFVTPNLVNDGHGILINGVKVGSATTANQWLINGNGGLYPGIDAHLAALRSGGLLQVTTDNIPKVDTSAPVTGTGIIYSVVLGPGISGSVDSTSLTHFGMLLAIQHLFGVSPFSGTQVDSHYSTGTMVSLPTGGGGGGDTTPPTAPTVTLTVQSSSSIRVALSGSVDNVGVTGYEISRSPSGAATWTVVAANTATPFTDTGLAASTAYDYRSRALDAAGNHSPYSATQTATTSPSTGGTGLSTTPTANTPGYLSSGFNFTTNIDAGRMWKTAVHNGVAYIVGESDHTIDHSGGGSVNRTTTPYISAVNVSTGAVIQTYAPSPDDVVYGCRLTADGKLVVWGNFLHIAGQARSRFAILNTLSGPTDSTPAAVDASSPDLQITGGEVRRCILHDTAGRGWIVGAFTSAGGTTHNRVARLVKTGGNWGIDPAFTASIASGTAQGLHALSNGTKIFVGGDIPNAIEAYDGSTGAAARFDFDFPGESASQHCIWVAGDDTFVYFGGDFGPNMAICTDTNGSGPTTFTNVVTSLGASYKAYWYVTCDGNVQVGELIVMGGVQYVLLGHHGNFCMPTKNTPYNTTNDIASNGIMCWRAGNVTNDNPVFLHPPDFGQDDSQGSPLKLWGAYQDGNGSLHVTGDFTTANGSNLFYRYARFDPTTGTTDVTPPTTPSGLTITVVGSTELDLAWTASTDTGGSGLAGYQIWRDDGSGAGFQLYQTVGVVTSYHDTGLAPGTFYQYHLIAFDGAGNMSTPGANHGATTGTTGGGGAAGLHDIFDRNVSNAWGTSTDGHPWTLAQGDATQINVVNGTGGTVQQVVNKQPMLLLDDIQQQDYDLTITYEFSALPTAGSQDIMLILRAQDASNYTRIVIAQPTAANAKVSMDRVVAAIATGLGSSDLGASQAANTLYKARIQAIGTTINARVWLASQPEPTAWNVSATDSVAPIVAGAPGLRFLVTSSWTGGAHYTVTDALGGIATPPPPPPPGTGWVGQLGGDWGGGMTMVCAIAQGDSQHFFAAGDAWGVRETLDRTTWQGAGKGVNAVLDSANWFYGRAIAASKKWPGAFYLGTGREANGGAGHGQFYFAQNGALNQIAPTDTFGFGDAPAPNPGNSPRCNQRMSVDLGQFSTDGIEHVYAGSNMGIGRSDDRGAPVILWTDATGDTNGWQVCFQLSATKLLVGTHRLNDGSTSTLHVLTSTVPLHQATAANISAQLVPGQPAIVRDVCRRTSDGQILAACGMGGVYTVSADGLTWTALSAAGDFVNSIAAGPGQVVWIGVSTNPATGSLANNNHCWARSGDGGSTWTWGTNLLPNVVGTATPWWHLADTGVILKGSYDGMMVAADPTNGNVCMISGRGGAYLTTDGLASMAPFVRGLNGSTCSGAVTFLSDTHLQWDGGDWPTFDSQDAGVTATELATVTTGTNSLADITVGGFVYRFVNGKPCDVLRAPVGSTNFVSIAPEDLKRTIMYPLNWASNSDGSLIVIVGRGGLYRLFLSTGPGSGGTIGTLPATADGKTHIAQSLHGSTDMTLDATTGPQLANLVDFIVGLKSHYGGQENAMAVANPNVVLGLYFPGNEIQTADARPESWYAHNAGGARVLSGDGVRLIQEPEVTSPTYAGFAGPNAFHANDIQVALGSTYGLFYMDNMSRWGFDQGGSNGPPIIPGSSTAWTWPNWRDQNLVSLIEAVKAANPNAISEINVLSDGSTFGGDITLAYVQHAKLAQAESFIGQEADPVTSYPTDSLWLGAVGAVLALNAAGVGVHARIGGASGATTAQTKARRVYAAATGLICDRGAFWLDPRLREATNLIEAQNAIWTVNMGPPLESPATITPLPTSGTLHVSAGSKTYARRFTNGLAIVVTDDSSARTVTLDHSDYVDFATGIAVGGATLTVQPNTGYLLTRSGGPPGGGGTTLIDDSGHGMTGTLIAGSSGNLPVGVAGPRGVLGYGPSRALYFDGTGGRVEIPDTIGTLNSVHWTLACWVKLDNPPGDTDSAHQRYEGMEKAGAYWVNVRYDTTPKYLVRTGSFFGGLQQGFDFLDSAVPIVPGTWAHICGTYDGSTLSVYINASLSSSKPRTGDSGGGTTEPLTLGAKHRYGSPGELLEAFMHGAITGAVMLPFAASASQVDSIMRTDWPVWIDKAATFTPAAGDVGQLLRAKQTATNRAGTAVAVGPASLPIAAAPGTQPQNISLPSLSDTTPQAGQIITANQGQWSGSPTPTLTDTIQISASPNGPWSNAAPANQPYNIPSDGSVDGMVLSVKEVAANQFGSMSARSAASSPIAPIGSTGQPINTVRPTLTPPSVSPGVTLTATEGTWSNLVIGDAALYQFQGRTAAGAVTTVLQADSTNNTYIPQPTDVQIRVRVTHHAADGTAVPAFSDWILPAAGWIIQPIFPQPGDTVHNALVDTSWQLTGTIPSGQAFYIRGDGGPWIRAASVGGGVLTASVTLIGGDGQHLIEGDVH